MKKPKILATALKVSVKTELGTFTLEMTERGIRAVRFPACENAGGMKNIRAVVTRVKRIAKSRLDLTGHTLFEQKVYRTLMKVPVGQVITYGELARRAGYPGAARAVGSAMRKNRLPLVIPCHRVVPASGGIGEYSAGRRWKRLLLTAEVP